jgi:hypothetical protein
MASTDPPLLHKPRQRRAVEIVAACANILLGGIGPMLGENLHKINSAAANVKAFRIFANSNSAKYCLCSSPRLLVSIPTFCARTWRYQLLQQGRETWLLRP